MRNDFNSSFENKIHLIMSYKHSFSYMLDNQSFPRKATGQLLAADSILRLLYYRKFSLVLITILKKKNIHVLSNNGKWGVTFQNE